MFLYYLYEQLFEPSSLTHLRSKHDFVEVEGECLDTKEFAGGTKNVEYISFKWVLRYQVQTLHSSGRTRLNGHQARSFWRRDDQQCFESNVCLSRCHTHWWEIKLGNLLLDRYHYRLRCQRWSIVDSCCSYWQEGCSRWSFSGASFLLEKGLELTWKWK